MAEYLGSNHISHTIRENEEKRAQERKRFLLYLISDYLRICNLQNVADTLNIDAQLSPTYEVCDNVDLDTILQEYQSYYHAKFNKYPKICKRTNAATAALEKRKKNGHGVGSSGGGGSGGGLTALTTTSPLGMKPIASTSTMVAGNRGGSGGGVQTTIPPAMPPSPLFDFNIDVTKLGAGGSSGPRSNDGNQRGPGPLGSLTFALSDPAEDLLTRPLCDFKGYTPEWQEMAQHIVNAIVPASLGMGWADCVGLDEPINLLKESVIYPLLFPHVFKGLISPWKGILLYGPPGTGKTLLAKALACESRSTFINVTSSGFISKWRGESEKLVKVLFDVAKFYAPSVIFIDELDAMASRRDDSQHDASRRFKSELLIQLDGILSDSSEDKIFVLASTNLPWDLDPAVLRRFEKRILVGLPDSTARASIFRYYFKDHRVPLEDCQRLADVTANYSGSDIKLICKEACMSVVRKLYPKLTATRTARNKNAADLVMPVPTFAEVSCAVEKTKPATSTLLQERYIQWKNNYGCM